MIRRLVVLICSALACSTLPADPKAVAFADGSRAIAAVDVIERFGIRIAPLPDVSGDGVADFAVGIFEINPDTGTVWLFSGADGALLRTLVPESDTAYPSSVADAGDIDRDGVHDVLVGSRGTSADGNRGALRVYSGADGSLLRTIVGASGEHLGTAVAGALDVDGDGAADLVGGAPGANGGRGRVYVFSGATGATLRTLVPPDAARGFGTSLARMPDADGDRRDDFAIGAPAIDLGGPRIAYAYSSATALPLASVTGDSPAFGARVGSAGDFDGDGIGDFYVADSAAGGTVQNGGLGVYRVYSGANASVLFEAAGSATQQELGRGGGAYDFDHDGKTNVILGARAGAATSAGSFAIRAGSDGHTLQSVTGSIANERFADITAALGDVDGDGRVDILATTFGASVPRVYVIAGGVAEGGALVTPGAQHSGLWYDPAHDGEGFVLEMLDATSAVAYYFTYTADGAQRYFVGVGRVVGPRIVFADFFDTAGGRLGGAFDPAAIARNDRSQLVLGFDGCNSGWAEYTVDGVRGRQRLARLSAIDGLGCAGAPTSGRDFSGSWYDPARSGEGWIVQSTGPSSYITLWFTYDAAGRQQWMIGPATLSGAALEAGALTRPVGGRFGAYFRPGEVVRGAWGTLHIDYNDCAAARVSWNGADGSGSSSIARLTRLSGVACAP